ncbi:MAG: hypothetical protein WCO68_05295 [Verrucomicrobiota bacterium]
MRSLKSLATAALLIPALASAAESLPEFPLWEKNTPGALGSTAFDIPTLTPYLPDPAKATGAAMIVCPGGGYRMLAAHEGEGYAKWFSENGIAAFVLKYRLGSHGYHHPVMLERFSKRISYSPGRRGPSRCVASSGSMENTAASLAPCAPTHGAPIE